MIEIGCVVHVDDSLLVGRMIRLRPLHSSDERWGEPVDCLFLYEAESVRRVEVLGGLAVGEVLRKVVGLVDRGEASSFP